MCEPTPKVAIVGATGLVGEEALRILESRGHPTDRLVLIGSERSVGRRIEFGGAAVSVREIECLHDERPDFVLCCADADTAVAVREMMAPQSGVLIDNSSAFRLEGDVPLVVPEVNAEAVGAGDRVIANPNCSTIMLVRAVDPLRRTFGVQRLTVTTYQAVSGAGRAGLRELREQTAAALYGGDAEPSVFPATCAFNVFEHESSIDPATGFNGEETKMVRESARLWGDSRIGVLPTCVRVPVERAHSQSIVVDLDVPVDVTEIEQCLEEAGVRVFREARGLTPRDAAGLDDVIVGRVRIDPGSDGTRAVLWICCDQIRKGAALNAVQIMDAVLAKRVERVVARVGWRELASGAGN